MKSKTKEDLVELLAPAIMKSSGEPEYIVKARLQATDMIELHYMEMRQRRAGLLPPETESSASSAERQVVIDEILLLGVNDPQVSILETCTLPELKQILADAKTVKFESDMEKVRQDIIDTRIEREADRLWFGHKEQLRREEEHKRRLVQFDQQDRQTFSDAARRYGFSATVEANWNALRGVLDPGFTSDQVGEVLRSGGVQLAEPTPAESETWERERIAAHNARLLALDPIELRKQAKLENVARTVQFEQEQDRREVEGTERRDATLGFPELPFTNSRGESLNSKFFMKADAETLRRYIKVYGPAQITRAIRERIEIG